MRLCSATARPMPTATQQRESCGRKTRGAAADCGFQARALTASCPRSSSGRARSAQSQSDRRVCKCRVDFATQNSVQDLREKQARGGGSVELTQGAGIRSAPAASPSTQGMRAVAPPHLAASCPPVMPSRWAVHLPHATANARRGLARKRQPITQPRADYSRLYALRRDRWTARTGSSTHASAHISCTTPSPVLAGRGPLRRAQRRKMTSWAWGTAGAAALGERGRRGYVACPGREAAPVVGVREGFNRLPLLLAALGAAELHGAQTRFASALGPARPPQRGAGRRSMRPPEERDEKRPVARPAAPFDSNAPPLPPL